MLTPGPITTTDTVKQAQVFPDICPREEEFSDHLQKIREDLVKIACGGPEYTTVLFGGSGTAVAEAVITSVVPPGKKILILNNGAYGERLVKIAKTFNINVLEISFPLGTKIDVNNVKSTLQIHSKDVSCVAAVHHETSTGMLNPIKEIGLIAEQYRCVFIVDAISSFAGIPFSIDTYHIDFLISTPNKCLQGLPGMGFVICKKSEIEKIKNYPKRSFYLDLWSQYEYLEKKKQTQFTPPVQAIYALQQAIKEFYDEGAENRYKRYQKNFDTLIAGLKERGFHLFLAGDVEQSPLLVTILEPEHQNFNFKVFHDKLYSRGFTIYPGKLKDEPTFRLGVLGAIDHHDIKNFLKALDDVLDEMHISLK